MTAGDGMKHALACWGISCVVALGGGACPGSNIDESSKVASSWQKLPPPPLSGRIGSLVAAVDDRLIVVGGWEFLCPPGANCVGPDGPPLSDGAAYDLATERWTAIADAPAGLVGLATAVVGMDVYALSQCDSGPRCSAGRALLRYRSDDDEWDTLPAPDWVSNHVMVALADGVVAYSRSDERGSLPDYRYYAEESRWDELPDDPISPAFDRFLVQYDDRLLLFGSPLPPGREETKLAAAYDMETRTWEELTDSGTQGYQVWRAGDLLYLNSHFGPEGGGIYDPIADAWSPLPDPPTHDMAGIIGDDEATYEYAAGWVLDTRTATWIEVEQRSPDGEVYDEVVAATADGALFVFGGQTWSGGKGTLLNDAWLWTPPSMTAL